VDDRAGGGVGGGSELADGGVADGAGTGVTPGAIPLPPPATSDITVAESSLVELPLTLVGASLATETDETGMTVTTSVTVVTGVAVLVEPEPSAPTLVAAPQEGETPGHPGEEGGGRAGRRVRRSRRRRWWLWGTVTVVVAVALAAAGLVSAQRINRPLHAPASASVLPASLVVAGPAPALPWPAKGQGAVAVPSLGFAAQSGTETPVPIASLTKMTTALVVLTDHPVPAEASGPSITVTAQDMAEYGNEVHNDQSTVPIRLGEVLTERQMLEAMLTQSANDIAFTLAVWDAGSTPAFVAKMNATALQLGATNTHYVDVSGYNPGSVSSASDCIRVAAAGMAIPTFAEVVGMSSVTLPLEGTVPNVVSEVGTTIGGNKVVGIKSGYTSEAKGCLVLAADRVIYGRSVLVLTAVLTQPVPPPIVPTTTTTRPKPAPTTTTAPPPVPGSPPTTTPPTTAPPATVPTTTTTIPLNDLQVPDPLRYTRPVTEALLTATAAAVVPVIAAAAGQPAGTVTAQWGGVSHRVGVVAARGAWLAAWPGQQVHITTTLSPVPPGGRTGRKVGSASYALGTQVEVVPLKLAATVPEPTWWWRLVHN
jgi:D-alanyl-D-alanine carboxypeptidase (penicillin-binding protein 5/6)